MTFNDFIVGYVGNLLATLTGVAMSLAIYKLFIPWFRTITYQGVDISGTWTMSANPTHHRDVTWELRQKAATISGISTHVAHTSVATRDRVRTYRLEGRIVNRFLTVTGYPIDPRRMGCISYIVEILGDATKMVGQGSGYSTVECRMIGGECTLTRKTDSTVADPKANPEETT
jgi:hypothetical protein